MKGKIVVIDDDRDLCNLYGLIFTPLGYEVHTAHNGLDGVILVSQIKPDVVLIDFNMPELNGEETVAGIRDSIGLHIPLIMISSTQDQEKIQRVKDLGVVEFIQKGTYDNQILFEKIEEAIANNKQGKQEESLF